jgi:hypothetical protein
MRREEFLSLRYVRENGRKETKRVKESSCGPTAISTR